MTDVNIPPTLSATHTGTAAYVPQRPWRSETVDLPGVRYHLTHWGAQDSALPPLVLAHGLGLKSRRDFTRVRRRGTLGFSSEKFSKVHHHGNLQS